MLFFSNRDSFESSKARRITIVFCVCLCPPFKWVPIRLKTWISPTRTTFADIYHSELLLIMSTLGCQSLLIFLTTAMTTWIRNHPCDEPVLQCHRLLLELQLDLANHKEKVRFYAILNSLHHPQIHHHDFLPSSRSSCSIQQANHSAASQPQADFFSIHWYNCLTDHSFHLHVCCDVEKTNKVRANRARVMNDFGEPASSFHLTNIIRKNVAKYMRVLFILSLSFHSHDNINNSD